MRRYVIALGVLVIGAVGQVRVVTLAEAVNAALQRHPLLATVPLIVPQAQADSIASSALPNPLLSLSLLQVPTRANQTPGSGWLEATNGQWQLTVQQDIDLVGHRQHQRRVGHALVETAGEAAQGVRFQAVLDAARRWLDVWYWERSLEIIDAELQKIDSIVVINRYRLQAQAILPADLWRTEMLAQQRRVDRLGILQQLATAHRWLQYALQTRDSLRTTAELPLPIREAPPLAELVEMAMEYRPDLRVARAQRTYAEENVRLQEVLSIPNPQIGISGMQQDGRPYVGLVWNYPLPLLYRNYGERQKAQLQLQEASLTLQRLQQQAATEIRAAYDALSASLSGIRQYAEILQKARDVLRTVELAYLKGETPIIDYLEAERSFYSTQQAYNQQLYQYLQAYVQLVESTGYTQLLTAEK